MFYLTRPADSGVEICKIPLPFLEIVFWSCLPLWFLTDMLPLSNWHVVKLRVAPRIHVKETLLFPCSAYIGVKWTWGLCLNFYSCSSLNEILEMYSCQASCYIIYVLLLRWWSVATDQATECCLIVHCHCICWTGMHRNKSHHMWIIIFF